MGRRSVQRCITSADEANIATSIANAEREHSAEIRVVVEGSRPIRSLFSANSLRKRAEYIFAIERVWDTERNNGVLLYVSLADRACEIVVDRGVAALVEDATWQGISQRFISDIKGRGLVNALAAVVLEIGAELKKHFPSVEGEGNRNELPDQIILR